MTGEKEETPKELDRGCQGLYMWLAGDKRCRELVPSQIGTQDID